MTEVDPGCEWFKINGKVYRCGDVVKMYGEEDTYYYGEIKKIYEDQTCSIQWFYLPTEMVLSPKERSSIHPQEVFHTETRDSVDIETVVGNAPIYFVPKKTMIPKILPRSWLILRRKYDPYKQNMKLLDPTSNTIPNIQTVNDALASFPKSKSFFDKENELPPPPPLVKKSLIQNRRRTRSSSSTETLIKAPSKTFSRTPRVEGKGRTPLAPTSIQIGPACKPSSQRKTNLTAEMESLAVSHTSKTKTAAPSTPKRRTAKSLDVNTPTTTRSGRKIKPVQSYSLSRSMAMEALRKSNLLDKEAVQKPRHQILSTGSEEDLEISFGENKTPGKRKRANKTANTTPNRRTSSRNRKDSDDDFNVKRNQQTRSIPSSRRNFRSAKLYTPCVIPARTPCLDGDAFTRARCLLHVSAVPETLPGREEQFADVYYFLESKLDEKSGGCMYISGVPGTGKTATVQDAIRHIADGYMDLQVIQVNGMKLSDPKQLYSLIYRHLEEKAVTPDHANLLLGEYFGRSEKKSILLIVDELDLLWTRKQHVMYNLFDWPNRPNSKLVVVAIANTMDLPERMLMNKVASRLGLTRMTFQPYSHHQLHGILTSRLEMAEGVFAPEACMLAARKVAAASGDARRALDICRHALDVAEREGSKHVGSIHIQKAITNMYQSVKTKAVTQATLYQKLFLKAVLGVFRRKGVEEAVYMEVYEVLTSLCQFQGLFAPPSLHVQALCGELGTARVLLVEEGPLTLHTHIRLNCSQEDLVFALKESD